jgi:hypothetical protein
MLPTLNKRLLLACAALAVAIPALTVETPLQAQVADIGLGRFNSLAPQRLEDARQPQVLEQVRIRQRVIIRISPSPPEARERLQALQPSRAEGASFREVAHDGCVRVENIIGVQPTNDNRLLLFMQNRNVLAASLDRECTAQAFYSGFYVERNNDGQLCVRRDLLQSRAGTSCAIAQLTRLVAAGG